MQLAATQADGSTLRQHLLSAARSGAQVAHPLLDATLPPAMSALWECFVALSAQRVEQSAIPASEIESWQRLHGVQLTAWEVETLQAVDRACVAEMRAQTERRLKQRRGH